MGNVRCILCAKHMRRSFNTALSVPSGHPTGLLRLALVPCPVAPEPAPLGLELFAVPLQAGVPACAVRHAVRLAGLTPSQDHSGGPWYNGQDFDAEFVGILKQQCHQYVIDCSKTSKRYATIDDIVSWVGKTGISKVVLTAESMLEIMHMLLYDGKIEEVRHGKTVRQCTALPAAPCSVAPRGCCCPRVRVCGRVQSFGSAGWPFGEGRWAGQRRRVAHQPTCRGCAAPAGSLQGAAVHGRAAGASLSLFVLARITTCYPNRVATGPNFVPESPHAVAHSRRRTRSCPTRTSWCRRQRPSRPSWRRGSAGCRPAP